MKRWIPWVATAIVIVVLGSGVWRAVAARKAQQQALSESTQRGEAVLALQPSELL
ncbi:MAG: efflux transporter periplasmic adaptor subunit, partial [Burkholderiaceae bacterium]